MEKKEVNEASVNKKISYEELENFARQSSEQSRVLVQKLQEANMGNMLKRLDYLFRVVELGEQFDEDFVNGCKAEIKEMIVLPEEGSEEEQLPKENN